jgi:hypothetical protein
MGIFRSLSASRANFPGESGLKKAYLDDVMATNADLQQKMARNKAFYQ